MTTHAPSGRLCLLVLIPHRDALRALHAYRRALFAAGIPGAYSFPAAAPLAIIQKPLAADELKTLARALKTELTGQSALITTREIGSLPVDELSETLFGALFPGKTLYGPRLCLPPLNALPAALPKTVLYTFPRVYLPGALIPAPSSVVPTHGDLPALPPFPGPLSFRACRLSSLMIRHLAIRAPAAALANELSFEWRLDPGVWLPSAPKPAPHKETPTWKPV